MSDVKDQLKLSLRKFPAAVTVISLRQKNGEFCGITATAVTVMTLQPPTLISCINSESLFAGALAQASHFCINVLKQEQEAVSAACAGAIPQKDREAIGHWVSGVEGVPVLSDAQANFICRKQDINLHGTHLLVFGEVLEARAADVLAPLLYADQKYGTFSA